MKRTILTISLLLMIIPIGGISHSESYCGTHEDSSLTLCAFPNPSMDETSFRFFLTESLYYQPKLLRSNQIHIQIFDVGGRLIDSINAEPLPGQQTVTWNTQSKTYTGAYTARVIVGDSTSVCPFVRLR